MPIPGSMPGLMPTVTVLLDDVSNGGTFPYDLTQFVRLADGITTPHGREDEFAEPQAAVASLTLENTDGRFTLGTTGGGYGAINVDRRIRVTYTVGGVARNRFTGYVQNWPVAWPDGSDTYATCRVTAVDSLARLSRRKLKTVIEQEILSDSPTAFYTLREAAGSTSAADSSGNSRDPLVLTGTGAAPTFGGSGIVGGESMTAVTFNGGKSLRGPVTMGATSAAYVAGFFKSTDTGATRMLGLDDTTVAGGRELYMGFAGQLNGNIHTASGVFSVVTTGTYGDGQWHHALLLFVAGSGIRIYVDGVLDGTSADMLIGQTVSASHFQAGAFWATVRDSVGMPFVGTLANTYCGTTSISAARISSHSRAGLAAWANETPSGRQARLASYANIPAADRAFETGVLTSMPAQPLAGVDVASAMRAVAKAEGGPLFVDGSGKVTSHNRQHRTLKVTASFTLAAIDLGPDSTFTTDMQLVFNDASVTRLNGSPQTSTNAASVTTHEQYPYDDSSLLVNTDDEAADLARWVTNTAAEPAGRLAAATVDLLTQTQANQQALQAAEVGDRFSVTGLPAQTPGGTAATLVVEGWTETLTDTSWEMVLNTSPWQQAQAWVLDNATYSVLDTTTRLHW